MKTFKYVISWDGCGLAPDIIASLKKAGPKVVFENYLNDALRHKNGNGVKLAEGRILNRILAKLDAATTDTLDLEEAEYDLIKSSFMNESAGWQPEQIRAVIKYIDNLEQQK